MKNCILLYILLFTALAGAQVINIPDYAFKNKLVTSGVSTNMVAADSSGDFIAVDENGDGQIDEDEAGEVRELYLQNSNIASLEGIAYFTNLRVLNVQYNNLTAFDASLLTDLRTLNCAHNQLTTLTVAGLDHLEVLVCNNNQLMGLAFSGMEYLESVNCSFNNISQLDFSGCPQFNSLSCASNNITYINLKNGTQQSTSNDWTANAGLAYVCIDEDEAAIVNNILAGYGYSATANSFCSFVPGGSYNTITGTLSFDDDNNGCDSGDLSQKFVKVTTTVGAETCTAFTDENGQYAFYTLAGTFTVMPLLENGSFFTAASSNPTVYFPDVNNTVATRSFCIAPTGINPDIEIVMEPIIPPVPGQDAVYKMVYKNKGTQVLSGTVNCTWNYTLFNFYPDSFTPYANTTETSGNMATYTWNYSNLQPFESRHIEIILGVHTPFEPNPVSYGDALTFTAGAMATGDVLPADNTHVLQQTAMASYGANAITCIEGATAPVSTIGDYLHYVVKFENEGTETVANVVIENDIDPTQFDVSSVEVLNSSHDVTVTLTGNTMRMAMPSVNLASTGHGNILFKAKTKNNLVQGAVVNSRARIFYDYSAPVDTNNATTEFAIMGTGHAPVDASVTIYPNPAKDKVSIEAQGLIQQVQLYDIQGRLLQTVLLNDAAARVDIAARPVGVYFIKVITQQGVKVQKIVKE